MIWYRFRHSSEWLPLDCNTSLRKDNFLGIIRRKHNLRVVVMEDSMERIRRDSHVVLRSLPRHRVADVMPVRRSPEPSTTPAYDITLEFGPDPYAPRPTLERTRRKPIVFTSNDPFIVDIFLSS